MDAVKKHDIRAGTLTDEAVIQRVLCGEKELFEILLRRYNQTLFRTIRSYLKNTDDLEDAMQETYIKAYKKLAQFKSHASFSTWLIRIGINEALQRIRKKKSSKLVHINDYHEITNKIMQVPDTSSMNPENQAIYHETRLLIEKAIDKLPKKYRIIYMLKEVEGLKNKEIAACLDLRESNVKVRLHRARHLLKDALYKLSADASVFTFGNQRCDTLVNKVMSRLSELPGNH